MDSSQVFCPNEACPARGQREEGNIKVHSRKEERYRYTVFYRKKTSVEIIETVVTLLAYKSLVNAVAAAFGLKGETVHTWAAEAEAHCEQVHQHLIQGTQLDLVHVQDDEMRMRIQGGIMGLAMAIMMGTQLWGGGRDLCPSEQGPHSSIGRYGAGLCSTGRLAGGPGWPGHLRASLFRNKIAGKGPGRPRLIP